MSNRRRPSVGNSYRRGYLKSRAWFARRDRWIRDELRRTGRLVCAGCGGEAARHDDLHHVDYSGVVQIAEGQWRAGEAHADLMLMHPACHELLHRLIERDVVLSRHRDRRTANELALERLRDVMKQLRRTP